MKTRIEMLEGEVEKAHEMLADGARRFLRALELKERAKGTEFAEVTGGAVEAALKEIQRVARVLRHAERDLRFEREQQAHRVEQEQRRAALAQAEAAEATVSAATESASQVAA